MLTHVEVSYMLTFVKKLVELNLKSYGYGFPLVVAINKGKALPVNCEHPNILDRSTCVVRDGRFIEDGSREPNDIFMQVLMLRLQEEDDAENIVMLYKNVAQQYDPDACVFVQTCLYNEYSDPSVISEQDMNVDPEVIHVVNFTYYTREDPRPRMCVSPLINKGSRDENDLALNDLVGEENEDRDGRGLRPRFQVLMIGCGWFTPYHKVESIMGNPYKGRR